MIINKSTKSILTRSDKPNENWTDEVCYIVDDNSELAGKILRYYPNIDYVIKDGVVTDVKILTPSPASLTHEEINEMVVAKIRERYDVNDEFKMINLGLSNPDDVLYVAYRAYVNECLAWGDSMKEGDDA